MSNPISNLSIDDGNIEYWLEEMRTTDMPFRQVFLDHLVTEKTKLFCQGLEQDEHVFVTAVEILDRYIAAQNKLKSKITEPFMVVLTAVYIAGKLSGDLGEIKTLSLTGLYLKVMKKSITSDEVKRMEMHIFSSLDFKLPLNTPVDDVKMLVHVYIDPLKIYVQDLCVSMLSFYVLNRLSLYKQLCHFYAQGDGLSKTFKSMYVNRFYVPFAVIICTLNILSLPDEKVNVDSMVSRFAEMSRVAAEHLCFLAHLIHEAWKHVKKSISKRV